MQKIQHFIWDFDGTLFDTYPMITACFQSALRDFGIETSREKLRRMMMKSIKQTMEYYTVRCQLGEGLTNQYLQYMKKESPETSLPFPYAKDACKWIHQSGKHNYLLTHRGESANLFLRENGMQEYFTECVTVDNGFPRKPDPEAAFYLIHKYGMKNDETLMVGDRELDIQCGKNAGIRTCFFKNDSGQDGFSAEYCFESMEDFYRELTKAHVSKNAGAVPD